MPTKQEEIKRFIVRDSVLIHTPTLQHLSNQYLRSVILENNDSFEMMRDPMWQGTILFCKNKPRSLPVYGVVWEVLDGN